MISTDDPSLSEFRDAGGKMKVHFNQSLIEQPMETLTIQSIQTWSSVSSLSSNRGVHRRREGNFLPTECRRADSEMAVRTTNGRLIKLVRGSAEPGQSGASARFRFPDCSRPELWCVNHIL